MAENFTYFYIRVSSKDQNEARQVTQAEELKINPRNIIVEKASGKNFEDRPQYQMMKNSMRSGDLLYVSSLDRLGRHARQIKQEWEELTQEIGIDIKVLDMPMLDTTAHKDQLGTFINELILQIMSYIAEQERKKTATRQKEGIAVAKSQGRYLGRPRVNLGTLSRGQKQDLVDNYEKWVNKEITGVSFAKLLDLKRGTFYKIMNEYERSLPQQKSQTQKDKSLVHLVETKDADEVSKVRVD